MTARVFFVGAGPGAADLITVRGARILAQCEMILYAGSLVPFSLIDEYASSTAERHDTATLDLNQQAELYRRAQERNWKVARVQSGDPAIYGATTEQMKLLREMNIPYEVVAGVSSFTACAATLGAELTRPEVTQSIVLTRVAGRASPMPKGEELGAWAAHGASLCLFLGGAQLSQTVETLLQHYPPHTPAALVQRATQPEERQHKATLGTLLEDLKLSEWTLTTMLIVSPALADVTELESPSRLYDPSYAHRFRGKKKP